MATSRRKKKRDEDDEDDAPKAGEDAFFQDDVVTVTSTRAIISGTTYALANITSVRGFVQPRPAVLFILGGSLLVMGMLMLSTTPTAGLVCAAIGLFFLFFYFLQKPKHWVRIGTAGAEANAVYSLDPKWTSSVVDAINEAIISRG
jgi:hypothetical protein